MYLVWIFVLEGKRQSYRKSDSDKSIQLELPRGTKELTGIGVIGMCPCNLYHDGGKKFSTYTGRFHSSKTQYGLHK